MLFLYWIEQILTHSPAGIIAGGGYYLARYAKGRISKAIGIILLVLLFMGIMGIALGDQRITSGVIVSFIGVIVAEIIGSKKRKR